MRLTSVIEALDNIFNRMRYPKRIVTDNGTSLISKKVMDFLKNLTEEGCAVCRESKGASKKT